MSFYSEQCSKCVFRTGEFVYDHGEEKDVMVGTYCELGHSPGKKCAGFKEKKVRKRRKK